MRVSKRRKMCKCGHYGYQHSSVCWAILCSCCTFTMIASDMLPENECDHTWVSADGRVSDFRSYLLYTAPVATPYNFCPKCGEKL